jgi:hypothetical protein
MNLWRSMTRKVRSSCGCRASPASKEKLVFVDDVYMEGLPEAFLSAAGFSIGQVEMDGSIVYLLDPELRIVYCNRAWDVFAGENGGPRLIRPAALGTRVLDVIPEPLKSYYATGYTELTKQGEPWEHDYECSSPELYRVFHMRVLLLGESYRLVENSVRVERQHDPGRPRMPTTADSYLNEYGIITMCCHCRRVRRNRALTASGPVWDWVPSFLAGTPGRVSHGLCPSCRAYYYPNVERRNN